MISRYSALALLRRAVTGARWQRAWRAPDPQPAYDVVVIGGGGHGLATAYYLAANHGIRKVAVLERGYLGSGNVGRNTTIVRSNYQIDGNTQFFEHSLKLWEGLSHELNYNVMLSQRGQIVLAHGPSQLDVLARKGNVMRLNGIDAELLDRADVARMLPFLDYSPDSRFPIFGGLLQRRAGTARHDAVAWGYARAADRLGVDIIEQCEVTGFLRDGDRITGVETTRGRISAGRTAISVAGHSSQVAALAGLRLPVESHLLQAFVSEPIKPFLDHVLSFGAELFYISQSDKGGLVFGGHIDGFNSLHAARAVSEGADRRRVRGRADPVDLALAAAAPLGGHPGHDARRQSLHRPNAAQEPVSERRLVLSRLQGDAGRGLVPGAHARSRDRASADTPSGARSLRAQQRLR